MTDIQNESILVIKLGALGDFIQALGPMKAIREHHPHAHITLLTTKPYKKFADGCHYFDDIWLDKKPKWYDLKGWRALRKTLNHHQFTRVYDLQNNDRTSLYFKLFKTKPEWVGTAKGASHRNASPERTVGHAFDGHVQTLNIAGIKNVKIDNLDWVQSDISEYDLQKPYVVIAAGSAPDRLEKRWAAEKFGELAKTIHGMGYQPVLIGTMAELAVNQTIKKACPEALDLTAKTTLFDIVSLGRNAATCIGNDTGPMHMMAPTGTPCLVLFSKHSDPIRHAPKGEHVIIIQSNALADLQCEEILAKFNPNNDDNVPKASATKH